MLRQEPEDAITSKVSDLAAAKVPFAIVLIESKRSSTFASHSLQNFSCRKVP
jgi:hypothetical protein